MSVLYQERDLIKTFNRIGYGLDTYSVGEEYVNLRIWSTESASG